MIVTVFRSRLMPGLKDEYVAMVARMTELARTIPGYISHKGFWADDGERVTIVEFEHAEGQKAKDFTDNWIKESVTGEEWHLILQTFKTDVFGRYLAKVWKMSEYTNVSDNNDLSYKLLSSGLAVPFKG